MEELWINLYEYGYIEEEDVTSVQLWLQALHEVGYEFPKLNKKKYRNVAVMGQFNYADSEDAVETGIYWYQKQMQTFKEVILAGPFSDKQVSEFSHHSIIVIQGRNDRGFVSPYENQMKALLLYEDNKNIDGVIYVHDDGVMNVTEIANGKVSAPIHFLFQEQSNWGLFSTLLVFLVVIFFGCILLSWMHYFSTPRSPFQVTKSLELADMTMHT